MNRRTFLKASTFFTITGTLSSCATNPVTGSRDLVLLSEDEETELGRNSHTQVMKSYRAYQDPQLLQYVTELGEKLAIISHRKELIYHFTVLDSPQVNAFAIPGGYVYVTRGMLAYLGSEAELAGVLGHELGHITARHGVKQYSKNQVTSILTTVFSIIVGNRQISNLSQLATQAILRGFGREAELEADRIGADYIAKVGYNPEALQNVIGVLKNQEEFDKILAEEENREPYAYHGIFSTHPDNDKRLKEVISAAKKNINKKKLGNNKKKYLNIIAGMPFGPGEGQGSSRGSNFYHRDLNFIVEFPKGWKIENLQNSILATSKNREEVIEVTMRDLNRKISAEELIKRLYGESYENGQEINKYEYKGYAATVKIDTSFGKSRKCRVAILYKNKKEAFHILATCKNKKNYEKNQYLFDKTIGSIRKLKEKEKKLGDSKKIVVYKVKKGDTYKKLSLKTAFSSHAENRLRVINNMFPVGEPEPGSYIKLIY